VWKREILIHLTANTVRNTEKKYIATSCNCSLHEEQCLTRKYMLVHA